MSGRILPASVGLVGFGSMGAALSKAVMRSEELGTWLSFHVYAKGRQESGEGEYGIRFTRTLRDLVTACDMIIVAVRPEQVQGVVREMSACLAGEERTKRKILVSIAAGIPLSLLRAQAGEGFSVVRVMPNTLVEVGKGLFGFCAEPGISPEQRKAVLALFGALGRVIELDESAMNAFTALAGCGPGFLFHIMDSFCEAGVSVGLTREAARTISVELMDGCASLAKATGKHPVLLREQGTSPSGMTIAGLNHFDRTGLRGHVIDAVQAAYERGKDMDREAAPAG